MRRLVISLLLALSALPSMAQEADTLQVYFHLRESALDKRATDYIDSLVFHDVLVHGQKLIVLGYADYTGSNTFNASLSEKRARNVQAYLAKMGFDKNDVTICIGKGKIERMPAKDEKGFAADRKVQIIIDRYVPPATVAPATRSVAPAEGIQGIAHAKVNETVALNNILFVPGCDVLLKESMPELDSLFLILRYGKVKRIRIEGHICCMGEPTGIDEAYNNTTLSTARARVVYDYLIKKGIPDARLSFVGLGNARPAAYPEVTPEDQKRNRRVEIKILSK